MATLRDFFPKKFLISHCPTLELPPIATKKKRKRKKKLVGTLKLHKFLWEGFVIRVLTGVFFKKRGQMPTSFSFT
jgi:hypothetical protein